MSGNHAFQWSLKDLEHSFPPLLDPNKQLLRDMVFLLNDKRAAIDDKHQANDDEDEDDNSPLVRAWREDTPVNYDEVIVPPFVEARGLLHIKRGGFEYGTHPAIMEEAACAGDPAARYRMSTPRVFWANFADSNIFGFADRNYMAQDEFMCAELPHLLGVREKLREKGLSRGVAPWIIVGTPRCMRIDASLYGHAWRAASTQDVRMKSSTIAPEQRPSLSIVTLVAPQGLAEKPYTLSQLQRTFTRAYQACSGVKAEGGNVLATGSWGCGAFGGRLEVMSMVQLLTARCVGDVSLWAHSLRDSSAAVWTEMGAMEVMSQFDGLSVSEALRRIEAMGFFWGVSNGT
eukprot:TRINITY_DN9100_c0_g1_i1.p1 TRINITY_DN9100_c0_g1~~TRINITY_DN9100_c0_g1_i1.p1  ORF type:complete len:345 (-),score=63.14 TRINITY_DN9100_c0_g1_i1:1-1035(-)